MKKILILLLLGTYVGNAQPIQDTIILRNVSREKFRWMIQKDTAKLKQLLDKNIQYIHSNGWVELKTDILSDIVTGKLEYKMITIETDTVRLYHNTGIVTGRGIFKVALDGKEIDLKLLYTEVYIKEKRYWKLVQRNACKLL